MTDIPKWAMQKARDLDGVGCGCHTDEEAANCDFFTCEEACRRPREAIARALMSAKEHTMTKDTGIDRWIPDGKEPVKAWAVVSEMWGLHADTVTAHKSSCEFLCKQSAESHPDAGPYRVIRVVITPDGE